MKIGVIGAGGWGTALADLLARAGHDVDIWCYEEEVARAIELRRENEAYLPGISLSDNIKPTTDIEEATGGKEIVVSVSPSHAVREVMKDASPYIASDAIVMSASKGVENESLMTMSRVLGEVLPGGVRIVVFSGPSFALEMVKGHPTAVVAASEDEEAAILIQRIFSNKRVRVYTGDDVIGLELGASLKNVMAIAAGISDGLGFGTNTRAALITRGLAEMTRLAVKMGGHPLTMAGLGGMGDLVLTCTGDLSRNRQVGLKLGSGMTIDEILAEMRMVAEGVKTARSAYDLAAREEVEMPIVDAVYRIIYEKMNPKDAVFELMTRDLKREIDTYAPSS